MTGRVRYKAIGEKVGENTPVSGMCCSCGYSDRIETSCLKRKDSSHCEHWWDGVGDEGPPSGTRCKY